MGFRGEVSGEMAVALGRVLESLEVRSSCQPPLAVSTHAVPLADAGGHHNPVCWSARTLSAFDCLASPSPPQVPRSFESTVWFHSQGWSMFPAFQCFAGTLQRIRGTGMKHP